MGFFIPKKSPKKRQLYRYHEYTDPLGVFPHPSTRPLNKNPPPKKKMGVAADQVDQGTLHTQSPRFSNVTSSDLARILPPELFAESWWVIWGRPWYLGVSAL